MEHAILGLGKRTPNARNALNLLYRKPIITAAELEKELGITHPTANALIRDFINLGILSEISGLQRGRIYAFDRYIGLFLM